MRVWRMYMWIKNCMKNFSCCMWRKSKNSLTRTQYCKRNKNSESKLYELRKSYRLKWWTNFPLSFHENSVLLAWSMLSHNCCQSSLILFIVRDFQINFQQVSICHNFLVIKRKKKKFDINFIHHSSCHTRIAKRDCVNLAKQQAGSKLTNWIFRPKYKYASKVKSFHSSKDPNYHNKQTIRTLNFLKR